MVFGHFPHSTVLYREERDAAMVVQAKDSKEVEDLGTIFAVAVCCFLANPWKSIVMLNENHNKKSSMCSRKPPRAYRYRCSKVAKTIVKGLKLKNRWIPVPFVIGPRHFWRISYKVVFVFYVVFFHFSVIQGPRTKIPCFICKRWALSTNTLEDLVTWCTKKSAKLIENCCEHPRCWFQHVYKPKLVRNEGRFLDDLETSRWIAGGFPALLTWSAMKNTPNYIVPTPTNRSDAANPLFFWWVKFRSSWREKRSGFDAFFEKKKKKKGCVFFLCPICVFLWWKESLQNSLQDELTYQRKAELKLAVHCTRRGLITNEFSMKITSAWPNCNLSLGAAS